MVSQLQTPSLGVGLYTPQEAAWFAKLRTQTFNRWFYGDAVNEPALTPRYDAPPEDRVVTFWDLMQAVAVRTVRSAKIEAKISLQHIRQVIVDCQNENIDYPLARKHTLYWYSNRLILKLNDGRYVGTKPRVDRGQLYHGVIIEPFLKEVHFDDSEMAQSWTPLASPKYKITLDANRRFGMPILEPNGILVSALTDAVISEGSIEAAAKAFETDDEAILLALKYQEYLLSAA